MWKKIIDIGACLGIAENDGNKFRAFKKTFSRSKKKFGVPTPFYGANSC
jgi:hypothetical protein